MTETTMNMSPPPPSKTPLPPRRRAASRKRRRMILVLSSLLVLGLAATLVLLALGDSVRLFYDPTEVRAQQIAPGEPFRLGGLVEEGSFRKGGDDLTYSFAVTDGNERIAVTYRGLLPDLFREGQGVVAEGAMTADDTFRATEVLAKHDENYLPKEVADSLKERGYWQHGEEGPEDGPTAGSTDGGRP